MELSQVCYGSSVVSQPTMTLVKFADVSRREHSTCKVEWVK